MTYATITTTQEILKTSHENYQQQLLLVTVRSEKIDETKKAN